MSTNLTDIMIQLQKKLTKYLHEADDDPSTLPEEPAEPAPEPEASAEPMPTEDPGMGDEGMEDEGMGEEGEMGEEGGMGGMGGMGMEEEPLSAHELGRTYELKKIYTRLLSIELYLSNETSPDLVEIHKYVHESINLFEVVTSNFDSYKDNLDEIIVIYYKFLKEIYTSVRKYYDKQKNMEKQKNEFITNN